MKDLKLDFRSKFDFTKSIQAEFELSDEEANTFLWILDMWDNKRVLETPSDFEIRNLFSYQSRVVNT